MEQNFLEVQSNDPAVEQLTENIRKAMNGEYDSNSLPSMMIAHLLNTASQAVSISPEHLLRQLLVYFYSPGTAPNNLKKLQDHFKDLQAIGNFMEGLEQLLECYQENADKKASYNYSICGILEMTQAKGESISSDDVKAYIAHLASVNPMFDYKHIITITEALLDYFDFSYISHLPDSEMIDFLSIKLCHDNWRNELNKKVKTLIGSYL